MVNSNRPHEINSNSNLNSSKNAFMIDLNESCVTIGGSSPKSSRFKIVRDKLLRKSAYIDRDEFKAATPSIRTLSSFKNFISSLNANGSKRLSACEYDLDSTTMSSASSTATPKSKSIFNVLRRKFSFLKSASSSNQMMNSSYRHSSHFEVEKSMALDNQMPRSITDTKGFLLNQINNNASSSRVNTLTNKECQDDVAFIFKRNSLNDCLNTKRSFRNYPSISGYNSYEKKKKSTPPPPTLREEDEDEMKRPDPDCLSLNYFKKETSI